MQYHSWKGGSFHRSSTLQFCMIQVDPAKKSTNSIVRVSSTHCTVGYFRVQMSPTYVSLVLFLYCFVLQCLACTLVVPFCCLRVLTVLFSVSFAYPTVFSRMYRSVWNRFFTIVDDAVFVEMYRNTCSIALSRIRLLILRKP